MTTMLEQRRIEAGIVKPLVRAFEKELGRERTRAVLAGVIRELAVEAGRAFRAGEADDSALALARKTERFSAGGALEVEVLHSSPDAYHFNVTRCRYAEMYRELGLAELGYTLSCNRDAAFVEGFSPGLRLTRTQTLMEGAPFCDFRYERRRD